MAGKSQGRFPVLDDPAFDDFRLNPADIQDSKQEIGKGTYGRVFQVKCGGSVRAAREFHPGFSIKGKTSNGIKQSFTKFRLSAQQHHDNIVQLLGVYENKMVRPSVLTLIMEKMHCSLSSLLEAESNIPNSTKLLILLDVSSGLKYLHCQGSPIVHGYLSSNNILLTAEHKAKISDIGIAQLVTGGNKKAKCQSFMAPELQKSSSYGPPADVFSYGAVMLHTITQQLPIIESLAKQPDLYYYCRPQINQIAADTFFKQLTELVKSCLYHDTKHRPQITLVSQMIEILTTKVPDASETKTTVASCSHDEVEQAAAVEQDQSTNFNTDLENMNLEFHIEKSIPTLPYSFGNHGPKVVGFTNLGNTCFFNSMLQCVHQTVDLHYAIAKGTRVYQIENSIEGLLPVAVKKPTHGLTATLQSFFGIVNQYNMTVSPSSLLQAIGRNNYRFGRGTQEDSHEVLRCLLSSLREEEINCIKQGVYSHYNVTQNFLKNQNIDGETKLSIKEYLSKVSKGICDVDCTIGVELVTTTICHKCETPLQLKEFCLDLALPMPHGSGKGNEGNTVVTSKQKFNLYLQNKGLHYHKPLLSSPKFETDLENSLWTFTKLDVLDENNKFICHTCSNAQNFQVVQHRVSKQILIHKLSPVLMFQMKRFTISSHSVTKDNQHVSFPHVLNMAPFCTTECLEDFGDSKCQILYGLYGVVVHSGSLHGGHYTARVRQRPLKKSLLTQSTTVTAEHQTYNRKAAEEGQWYYTSDSHVSPTGFDQVKSCQAYLLFYEMLPGNEWLREVNQNRKASRCSEQIPEPTLDQILISEEEEFTNQMKTSIKDRITELDELKAKTENSTRSFEVTVQSLKGYIKVFEEHIQAVEEYKKNFSEISLAVEEHKKSYEELLNSVEQQQTKHHQNIKQIVEDKDNQINKLASDLKSKEEEIEQLKHNAEIKMTKMEELEKQIETLSSNLAEQNAKEQRLEMTVKEMKDSKEAAELEHQQTLDQHQVEVAKIEEEKKKLQDTIRAQDDELDKAREALKQSEDSKQATANENCKLLKDLENSRSCNDSLEKKIEELNATIEKQKPQQYQIKPVVTDDVQSQGNSEPKGKEEEQEEDGKQQDEQHKNVKQQQKSEQQDEVEQEGNDKQQIDSEKEENSKQEDLQEQYQQSGQQGKVIQQEEDGKQQKEDEQEGGTKIDNNEQEEGVVNEQQQSGKRQQEVELQKEDNPQKDHEQGEDDKQKVNDEQQENVEQQQSGKRQHEVDPQEEGYNQQEHHEQREDDKQKVNNEQKENVEQQQSGKRQHEVDPQEEGYNQQEHHEQGEDDKQKVNDEQQKNVEQQQSGERQHEVDPQEEGDNQQEDHEQGEDDKQKENDEQQENVKQQQNGKQQDEVKQEEEDGIQEEEGDGQKDNDKQQRNDKQQQSDEQQCGIKLKDTKACLEEEGVTKQDQKLHSHSELLSQKSDKTQASDNQQETNEMQCTNKEEPKKSEQQGKGEQEQKNGEQQRNTKQQAKNNQQEPEEDEHKKPLQEENEQEQRKGPSDSSQNKKENNQVTHQSDGKYQDGSTCTKIKPVVKTSNTALKEGSTSGED